jgi:hypothetical protein
MDEDGLTFAVLALALLGAVIAVGWIVHSTKARAAAVASLVAERGWSVSRGRDRAGRSTTTYADPAGGWRMTATTHKRHGGPALDFAGTIWESDRHRAPAGTWAVVPAPPGGTEGLGAMLGAFDGPIGQGLLRTMLGGADLAPSMRPVAAPGGAARGFLLLADAPVDGQAFDFAALDGLLAGHEPFAGVFAGPEGVTLRLGETLDSGPKLAAFADLGARVAALFPPR